MDPLSELMVSESTYGYGFNNPVRYTDPYGLAPNDGVGADGLTNEQWLESSRPGASAGLAATFKSENRQREIDGFQSEFNLASGELDFNAPGKQGEEVFRIYDGNTVHVYFSSWSGFRKSNYSANKGGVQGDSDNWFSNLGTAAGMTLIWATGERLPFGAGSHYSNDEVAGAMRNARGVEMARNFFYNKYKGASNLKGASVTNFGASFGLSGLVRAGIDPIEQFVGSYTINISAAENKLRYTLTNTSSFTSFFYGIGPSWSGGPMGNFSQTYHFTEPINYNRIQK